MIAHGSTESADESAIFAIERPHSNLLIYYLISSFIAGPLFFVPLIVRAVRYRTLRYRFDAEGVSMRWGILFRREINLAYRRIQDIHLSSNALERWLDLARIQIQTASGSANAEMTIEGIREFAALRDFLYRHMRGTQQEAAPQDSGGAQPRLDVEAAAELTHALRVTADELRRVREALQSRTDASRGGGG